MSRPNKAATARTVRTKASNKKHATGSPQKRAAAKTGRYNPQLIRPSKWCNRDLAESNDAELGELRKSIEATGGNLVAIKIRRAAPTHQSKNIKGDVTEFEIVYGHRRHRCCLDLGIPVLAVEESVDDVKMVQEMMVENEEHKSLSAWELGRWFAKMCKEKLFVSQRQMALKLNRDPGDVRRALRLAKLPVDILKAVQSPTQFALHDADKLGKALAANRKGSIAIAKKILQTSGPLPGKELVRRLTCDAASVGASNTTEPQTMVLDGIAIGEWRQQPTGSFSMKLKFSLTTKQQVRLEQLVLSFGKANTERDSTPRSERMVVKAS
ncbi:ParB/RepB/Spo0J family partition protein [Roseateles sp.]|uniref:ParB/RepB/Spo0J family partition protein n=1 Tax=Roseateles sp. TaxID=1971397 RepID=UPI00286BD46D|nr:ParB/RepB/Spo0J family partition protein [Roseateles sp.]